MPLHPRALSAIIARRKAGLKPASSRAKAVTAKTPAGPVILSYGATEVTRFAKETHIVHLSKSGATEDRNVRSNFDRLFGPGSFAKVRPHGSFLKDPSGRVHSDPSSSYVLTIPNEFIDAIAA